MKKLFSIISIIVMIVAIFVGLSLYRSYATGSKIQSRSLEVSSIKPLLKTENLLSTWTFVKVDTIHEWSGNVSVYGINEDIYIVFSPDFRVVNGPDLYVYLSGAQNYGGAVWATIDNTLNLGAIQSKQGEQIYRITKSEWDSRNHSILIWCRAFGVHFSHAILANNQ
jgi:Electron transfer DM13